MFFALVPFVLLVLLRGLVGVDMPMYEQTIDKIILNNSYTFTFEPLFEYIILLLGELTEDSTVILKIFAGVSTVSLLWGAVRLKKALPLFSLFIVPYFYLDMTMNGIRYGLAFSLIFLAVSYLVKGSKRIFYLIVTAACFIQISSVLLAFLLFVLIEKKWKAIALSIPLSTILILIMGDYLGGKLEDVSALSIDSVYAGLAPLFLSVISLVVFWLSASLRNLIKVELLLLLSLSLCFYALTQFTYAGLRFQTMNLFLIYTYVICVIHKYEVYLNIKLIVFVFIVGISASLFRLKNFYSDAGQGDAPFAPYQYFWER